MEKNPYTFSTANPRLATSNCERSGNVMLGAGLLFAASLHLYNRRFFRIDGNAVNFLAFAGASLPASFAYSNFFLSSAVVEAGAKNNEREH